MDGIPCPGSASSGRCSSSNSGSTEPGDVKTVHRLQRLLMRSRAAKCLAVRRVTQDNQGKRTAGVDGVKALTPPERLRLANRLSLAVKPRPTRRVWIPKPGTTECRPLGIPTMHDRAVQALAKLALEPEWEARFEPNSYGFRPGRSGHDAIEAIFQGICRKPKYVLDADIVKCFDRIDHQALLRKLGTFPALRRAIRGWLRAGVMDGPTLFPTTAGTPQGGVITPPTTWQTPCWNGCKPSRGRTCGLATARDSRGRAADRLARSAPGAARARRHR
ncbi:MAG TPA: reverse transcriptase domain-containing protein [Streptosporangiaceae bacterium]|nr:reverse transcriptase domain-containing protein [Streptosporangiaceae bacterium]